jgi:hypothetical protein
LAETLFVAKILRSERKLIELPFADRKAYRLFRWVLPGLSMKTGVLLVPGRFEQEAQKMAARCWVAVGCGVQNEQEACCGAQDACPTTKQWHV